MKYRKNPIVIEAEQYIQHGKPVRGMCDDLACPDVMGVPHVHTIHDNQFTPVALGDWILPEPDGKHYYPCKPEIFAATYELIAD